MPRNCKVCASPNRLEYEKQYLESHLKIDEIFHLASKSHPEDGLSYYSIRRHFKNHVEYYLAIEKQVDKERKELYKRVLKQDIVVAEQLLDNLKLCNDKIQAKAKEDKLDPGDEKILLDWLSEARMTIEQVLKWKDKIEWETPESEEDLVKKIMDCMQDFPPELLLRFKERWEKYETGSSDKGPGTESVG